MHLSSDAKHLLNKYHTNCDDAQTDQSLVWSYFPQINVSGKQIRSQKGCGARDVSNVQADFSLRHSHVLYVSFLLYMYSSTRSRPYGLFDQIHFVDSS